MAKYDEGDEVRLKRNMEFGNVKIRKTTIGEILEIKKRGFKKIYKIKWRGVGFPIEMDGDKDFVAPNPWG